MQIRYDGALSLRGGIGLHHGDCLDLLPTIEAGSVDAVITDPPYGIGYASSWMTRMDGTARRADRRFGKDVFDAAWLRLISRVLSDTGAVYLCTRWDVAHKWRDALDTCGLTVHQRIVWDKRHWGMGNLRYFGSQTEDILFASKHGHNLLWDKRQGNLWGIWRGEVWRDGYTGHPTQKPVALFQRMIELSCPPGGIVFDPFMGSGSCGVACVNTGRSFIGIELDRGYFDIAVERITHAQNEMIQTELELT